MKNLKRILIAVAMIFAIGATTMNAQVKFGLKAGVAVNDLKFDESVISADNRAGFTGGAMLEVMLPIANLGFDISAMYVHRTGNIYENGTEKPANNRDYIEIPLNLKWKIGLPVVGKVVSPYIFTGPSVAFLTSKENIEEAYKNKKVDVAWNFGVGEQLINKIQIGASYGLGLTKAIETLSPNTIDAAGIEGKNRYWTITAAYLF